MFTLIVVAICVAALFFFNKKKPPFGPAAVLEQEPERRIQLLTRKLQEVADERLMNDTLEDLGVSRPKPSRPVPASA